MAGMAKPCVCDVGGTDSVDVGGGNSEDVDYCDADTGEADSFIAEWILAEWSLVMCWMAVENLLSWR